MICPYAVNRTVVVQTNKQVPSQLRAVLQTFWNVKKKTAVLIKTADAVTIKYRDNRRQV